MAPRIKMIVNFKFTLERVCRPMHDQDMYKQVETSLICLDKLAPK